MTTDAPDRRSLLAAAAALTLPVAAQAQERTGAAAYQPPMANLFPVAAPSSALTWEAVVEIGPMVALGQSPLGLRRMIPITGGTFEGPRIRGKVLPGGADRQLVRPDGVTLLNALYEVQAEDGAVITVLNRVTLDPAAAPAPYNRSVIELTAPEGPHGWLNRAIFVGTLHPLPPERKAVVIRVYEVV
jgi:hypothetical protein